ncbi:MAG: helix-turn-helix domain-containing protein [Blastocatellia bacterium]
MKAGMDTKGMAVDMLEGIDLPVSLVQAAQLLSVSIWTVRKWVSDKRIKSIKLGGRRMIPKSEIQRITNDGLAK